MGGCEVFIRLADWLIFWRRLVWIYGTMHLHCFDIGEFIPLSLSEVVLVGWFGWVVVPPHDLGDHICIDPPGYFSVGWVLPSLSWVRADVLCPGVDGPG